MSEERKRRSANREPRLRHRCDGGSPSTLAFRAELSDGFSVCSGGSGTVSPRRSPSRAGCTCHCGRRSDARRSFTPMRCTALSHCSAAQKHIVSVRRDACNRHTTVRRGIAARTRANTTPAAAAAAPPATTAAAATTRSSNNNNTHQAHRQLRMVLREQRRDAVEGRGQRRLDVSSEVGEEIVRERRDEWRGAARSRHRTLRLRDVVELPLARYRLLCYTTQKSQGV